MSYRLALLVGSLSEPKLIRQVAEWAKGHSSIDLVAILVESAGGSGRSSDCSRSAALALRVLNAIEQRLVLSNNDGHDHVDLSSISGTVVRVSEVQAVRDRKLDAIIDLTSRGSGDAVAGLARDGVISVTYGEGGVAAFREVLDGRPNMAFAVQRRRDGRAEVLFRGSATTQLFYSQSREAIYDRSTPYLLRTIERLAGDALDETQPAATPSIPKPIGFADVMTYVGRTLGRVGHKAWRHVIGREWNWGVAYTFAPWQEADLSGGKILPKLPGTFVADPFVAEAGTKRYIFVEEFPYSTRKGVISVFQVDEAGAKRLGVAIEEPYHLSFPFLFQKDGSYFMVPEGQGGGELVLYECTDFPLQWRRSKVIMPKVCADTVVFEHGSHWWMLTTIKGEGRAENSAELHAFYADDPLGDWQPHSNNPVVMDASKGRNGGLLKDEQGGVYRVAQRASFRTYGDGFAIFRIDELTPNAYRETLVREVEPDFFPDLAGAHHMHSQDGLTVYDFNRDERP